MSLKKISVEEFNAKSFTIFDKDWMLLTAGSFAENKFNCMTISWGGFGTMWFRPIVTVGVRPQRHTFDFIEKYDNFTLTAFDEEYQKKLMYCGKNSGKDVDKIKECDLSPIASDNISAPGYQEANLIIECKKLYSDSLRAKNFMDKTIVEKCYPNNDFHKIYYGEVLSIKIKK